MWCNKMWFTYSANTSGRMVGTHQVVGSPLFNHRQGTHSIAAAGNLSGQCWTQLMSSIWLSTLNTELFGMTWSDHRHNQTLHSSVRADPNATAAGKHPCQDMSDIQPCVSGRGVLNGCWTFSQSTALECPGGVKDLDANYAIYHSQHHISRRLQAAAFIWAGSGFYCVALYWSSS